MSGDGTNIDSAPSLGPRGLVLEHRPLFGPLPSPETVRVNVGVLLDERLQPLRDALIELDHGMSSVLESSVTSHNATVERLAGLTRRVEALELAVASIPLSTVVEAVQTARQMVANVAVRVESVRDEVSDAHDESCARFEALAGRFDTLEQRFATIAPRFDALEQNSFGVVMHRLWRRLWRR